MTISSASTFSPAGLPGATSVDGASAEPASDAGTYDTAPRTPDAAIGPVALPGGEDCASATDLGVLNLDAAVAFTGTTLGANADQTHSCNGESIHPDVVYRVAFSDNDSLRANFELVPDGWQPAMALYSGTGSCSDQQLVKCTQNGQRLRIRDFEPEDDKVYYVWIDGGNSGSGVQGGSYTLAIDVAETAQGGDDN